MFVCQGCGDSLGWNRSLSEVIVAWFYHCSHITHWWVEVFNTIFHPVWYYYMTNIRIASVNSNGLNGQIKRAMCLDYLWRHIIDVAFIQESHLREDDVKRFASSSFNSRSRGSLVALKRSLSLSIMETFGSSDGCISYVKAVIAGRETCLISIYTPNQFELKYSMSLNYYQTYKIILQLSLVQI